MSVRPIWSWRGQRSSTATTNFCGLLDVARVMTPRRSTGGSRHRTSRLTMTSTQRERRTSSYALETRRLEQLLVNRGLARREDPSPASLTNTNKESLGVGGVPATYFEYLDLLQDVFVDIYAWSSPGGRIAVNIEPWSTSVSLIVGRCHCHLGTAWPPASWRGDLVEGPRCWRVVRVGNVPEPHESVLREITERVIIASKGRFDRALTPASGRKRGLPSTATISRDEFIEATTDLWELAPESATKVGHPTRSR